VLTGPAEYVVFNARHEAQPVVVWTRPNYRSSLVVLEESPAKSLATIVIATFLPVLAVEQMSNWVRRRII
jgi:hypothetical protein